MLPVVSLQRRSFLGLHWILGIELVKPKKELRWRREVSETITPSPDKPESYRAPELRSPVNLVCFLNVIPQGSRILP